MSSNRRDIVLGIDPGFTGAIAAFDFHQAKLLALLDTPLIEPTTKTPLSVDSKRKEIDVTRLANVIARYQHRCALAVLERVASMPGQGVVSTFRFGEGFGMLRGILAASSQPDGIRTLMPAPSVWKPQMGVTADKTSSLLMAREKAKDTAAVSFFVRQKDHGRAEAFLLALYGAKLLWSETH